MEEELEMLASLFINTKKPMGAIIGGSKVSTKLALLEHLIETMDMLIIGGAMANTFLLAQGYDVGKSICEPSMKATAKRILKNAEKKKCRIVLPWDLVVVEKFAAHASCTVVDIDAIPKTHTAVDVGRTACSFTAKPGRPAKPSSGTAPSARSKPALTMPARSISHASSASLRMRKNSAASPAAATRLPRLSMPAWARALAIFPPPAARSLNGWKAKPCRASPCS